MEKPRSLEDRLAVAGVAPGSGAVEAWRRLRRAEGPRATANDLYALVARERGVEAHQLPREERLELARSVMPDVWPGFNQTAGSERVNEPVAIADYDPGWSERYEAWRRTVADWLGDVARRIEHVGSTSVPGLPAKPVIDIQVSVDDLEDEARYVPALERAGLQLRSRDDLHRYFRPFPDRPRDVHVHVCQLGSEWERDHGRQGCGHPGVARRRRCRPGRTERILRLLARRRRRARCARPPPGHHGLRRGDRGRQRPAGAELVVCHTPAGGSPSLARSDAPIGRQGVGRR